MNKTCGVYFPSPGDSLTSFSLIFSIFIVVIRACSFLSNSYILEEGKVASFLLATTGILKFCNSILKRRCYWKLSVLALQTYLLGCIYSRDCANASSSFVGILSLYKSIDDDSACGGLLKFVIAGTILSYVLIAVYWTMESNLVSTPLMLQGTGKVLIPRIIYAIGIGQLLILALSRLFRKEKASDSKKGLILKVVAMLSAWSSTVIIVSGKQGWCIMRLENLEHEWRDDSVGVLTLSLLSVTQWSLLAVSLFFCTGHWCSFDGL